MNKILGMTILAALLAGACGDADTVTGAGSADSASVYDEWVLVEGPVPDVALGVTTLRIDVDGGAGGATACNGYFSDVGVDGDRWLATGFGVTEMGCEPDRMDAQSQYLAVLVAMTRVSVSASTLELSSADGDDVLRFDRVIPPADSDLVGTTWVLESLVEGDAVSSTMGEAEDATLVLGADGSVSGTDGCGSLSGSYETDGEEIRWTVIIDPDTACRERFAAQSGHIRDVLSMPTAYEIDGPRLILTAPSGSGLDYRDRS
jgi:heat shock protein HslJ